MSVKFLKKYGTYNEGETATFTPEREADLLKRKVAVSVVVPPKHKDGEEDELAKSTATGGGDGKKNPEQPQNRQTTGTSSKQK